MIFIWLRWLNILDEEFEILETHVDQKGTVMLFVCIKDNSMGSFTHGIMIRWVGMTFDTYEVQITPNIHTICVPHDTEWWFVDGKEFLTKRNEVETRS